MQGIGQIGIALLLAAVPQSEAPSQEEIERAISRGVEHVRALYLDGNGRGGVLEGTRPSILHHPGLHALSLYALLRSGVPAEDPAIEVLLASLALDPIETTYDASCLVLALCALDPVEHRAWLFELVSKLEDWQEEVGDWGYPEGGDLSNTQFAALALHAASSAGFKLPVVDWSRLAAAVLPYQNRDGGFGYVPRARVSTGSMTTAGVGTLAICEIELVRAGALETELEVELRAARKRGRAWLAKNFTVDANPNKAGWTHYYLYGLERVGALDGVDRLREEGEAGHDWYGAGARFLVDSQLADGSWSGTFDRLPTLFALLFLRRATRPRVPTTGGEAPAADAAETQVWLAVDGRSPAVLSIRGFVHDAVAALQFAEDAGGGPRVVRVEYLANGLPIGVVLGDDEEPSGGRAFACRHHFTRHGVFQVQARVTVRSPSAEPPVVLHSNTLELEVSRGLPVWQAELEATKLESVTEAARPKAKASSVHESLKGLVPQDFSARRAVDGSARTPWIAEPDDSSPTLTVSFARPQRVSRLRVFAARGRVELAMPKGIEVRVGRGAWIAADFGGDPGQPLEIVLGGRSKLRSIDLRLVRREGEGLPVGIAELELLAP